MGIASGLGTPSCELWGRLALNIPRGTTRRAWAAPRPPSLALRPTQSSRTAGQSLRSVLSDMHEARPQPLRPWGRTHAGSGAPGRSGKQVLSPGLPTGSTLGALTRPWPPRAPHPGGAHAASAPESSAPQGRSRGLGPRELWTSLSAAGAGVRLPMPALGGPGPRRRQQLRARSAPDGRDSSAQWLQPCHRPGVDPPVCTGATGTPLIPPGAQGVTLFGNRLFAGEIKLRLAHPGQGGGGP